ncbi:MAG: hypothetical protein AAGU77_00940, partial [Bacillota bacterium]
FQPMNVTYGIMEPLERAPRDKEQRYTKMAERALAIVEDLQTNC